MTPLKPTEKRLLLIVGVCFFLLLNFFGWKLWSDSYAKLTRRVTTLQSRQSVLNNLRTLAPEADAKLDWLNHNLKAYADETQREIYLDAFVRDQADNLGLELRKNAPEEAITNDENFIISRYRCEVSGSWSAVLRFLWEVENPLELRKVVSANLTFRKRDGAGASADEKPEVICDVRLEKYWSRESGNIPIAPDAAVSGTGSGASEASVANAAESPRP